MSTVLAGTGVAAIFGVMALINMPYVQSAEATARANPEERQPIAFTFRFNTKDLASSQGAKSVYQDLKRQARKACALEDVTGSRIRHVDRQCIAELIANVVQRVGSGVLAEQHNKAMVASAGR